VLSALIPLDPKTALLFVQQLSKVYRYILDAGKESFASVQVEMDSLDAYAFLLKQRFGNAIIWKITSEHNIKGRIPALSLQLLAENAVKHNIVSAAKPLTIQIIAKNDVVKVINNVQEKHISEPSTGTGLNNISQRYLLSGHTPPEIHQSNELFEVILPIIKDTDDTSTNN
jgi:LytS/YehU family sensor histidine kinase